MSTSRPTMDDVAARAGVSRALVSLVMRGAENVSEHRRAAVLEAADALGYRPNHIARSLASNRSMTLGVLLSDLHNPFFAQLVDGIIAAAEDAGYRVLISTGSMRPDRETRAVESMLEVRPDGMILAGAVLSEAEMVRVAADVPMVTVASDLATGRLDSIVVAGEVGARLAVDHLVGLGHRRIAHVDGGEGAGAAERRRGYEAAMADHGLADHVEVLAAGFTDLAGADAVTARLALGDPRPTALFCANDLSAVGAIDALDQAGLDVPGDVSVVGFDDIAFAALHHIDLTTVSQPIEQMGRRAVEVVLGRVADGSRRPASEILQPELVVRATTGPPAADH